VHVLPAEVRQQIDTTLPSCPYARYPHVEIVSPLVYCFKPFNFAADLEPYRPSTFGELMSFRPRSIYANTERLPLETGIGSSNSRAVSIHRASASRALCVASFHYLPEALCGGRNTLAISRNPPSMSRAGTGSSGFSLPADACGCPAPSLGYRPGESLKIPQVGECSTREQRVLRVFEVEPWRVPGLSR
jgi:hypothetical protein